MSRQIIARLHTERLLNKDTAGCFRVCKCQMFVPSELTRFLFNCHMELLFQAFK